MNTIFSLYAGLFLVAGSLVFFTGVAAFNAIRAIRLRDRKRFWQFAALTFPLAIATVGVLWLGIQNGHVISSGNLGFGPDLGSGWQCTITGGAAAEVCLRKIEPRNREHDHK